MESELCVEQVRRLITRKTVNPFQLQLWACRDPREHLRLWSHVVYWSQYVMLARLRFPSTRRNARARPEALNCRHCNSC